MIEWFCVWFLIFQYFTLQVKQLENKYSNPDISDDENDKNDSDDFDDDGDDSLSSSTELSESWSFLSFPKLGYFSANFIIIKY